MAKNRKSQSAAVRFGPAIKAFLLCLLIGGSGVGYVWQKSQINELWAQIGKRDKHLAELRDQSEKMRRQLAMLQTPQYIEMRIKELNLGLVQPQPAQIWRMVEPPAEIARPADGLRGAQYAARQSNNNDLSEP